MTNYQEITTTDMLDEILKSSEQQPILFFKHSKTCGVSSRAFAEFQRYLQSPESAQVRNCLIVIQQARDVSNELARLIGVQHESPQAIIVREGRAVWNESHFTLESGALIEAVRKT
ncbi:MAG: bacillithiol system redox-active protein YtxJ [Acidobacteria bacterium]|nr:bacillithiol system redox-active protein YtxJ [Acidobacteriota bacterium]